MLKGETKEALLSLFNSLLGRKRKKRMDPGIRKRRRKEGKNAFRTVSKWGLLVAAVVVDETLQQSSSALILSLASFPLESNREEEEEVFVAGR